MHLRLYDEAHILRKGSHCVTAFYKIWGGSYQQWVLRPNWKHASHSLVHFCFMHLKQYCFQNWVWQWVTPGRDSRDRLTKMNTLPVQTFLELEVLFFNKTVNGCSSFNFDNFVTRSQSNDHNLRHVFVYSCKRNLVLFEQNFFCRMSKYANILAR